MSETRLESPLPVVARLRTALGLAAGGAVLLAVGPLVGVVDASAPPAFTSWPLLAVLAFLPVLVAGALMPRNVTAAAAVLAAVAAFAPGRLLSDLQIAREAIAVSRPELLRPTDLDPLTPTAGLWLLVVGHLLTLAAGVLALSRSDVSDDEAGASDKLVRVVLVSAAVAIGLLGTPFTSNDPVLLAHGPWELPLLGLAGGLLVAVAAPLVAALSVSSTNPDARRGGLIGVAVAVVVIATPPLVSGLVVDNLGVSWAPIAALVAAAFLLLERPDRTVPAEEKKKPAAELSLPGVSRMHATAGVLGVLAGVATIVGALTPHLTFAPGIAAPVNFAAKMLLPAGGAVAVLGACLLVRGIAAAVRPAFAVSLAVLPLTAAGALATVLTATRISAVQVGAGLWWMTGGLVLAAVAGVCAVIAGAMEREDVETEQRHEVSVQVLAALFFAALFSIGAFALPALRAEGFVSPGLLNDFRVASWGLLIGLLAVLAAVALAFVSRPPRAAALLCGAAVVVGVRLLELPLTGGRAPGVEAGPGTWLAAATLVALLVAAGLRASEKK